MNRVEGRRRFLFLFAAAAVAILFAATTIVRIPDGAWAVRTWKGGGTPDLLEPGWALRFPGLQRLERFPGGEVRAVGRSDAASREGTHVGLPFEVRMKPGSQGILELARAGRGDAAGELARRAAGRLTELAAGAGTYDLASGQARAALEAGVRDFLRRDAPEVQVEVALGEPELAPEVRASFARESLYASRVDTGLHVLLIGLDGADWDVIDPMIARGELPQLAALRRSGAWGRLRSNVPTLSPLLWTTVATGKSPDRHGINDFLVVDPKTNKRVPINATFRRVRAFWNILSEADLPVDVIAWWASWPAEPVRGHLISDRVAYSTFDISDRGAASRAVFPADYAPTVERLRVRDADVTWEQVSRFLHVSRFELEAARASAERRPGTAPPSEAQTSIQVFTRVLAATETYRRVALDLLRHGGKDRRLLAVYFQGIDEVNHRFAHCAPPRAALCPAADYPRFKDAVAEFYRYQDGIVGELLQADPDATTLLLSDHGFASGEARPTDVTPFIEGKPGLWHDIVGVFAARGPAIRPGEVPTVTLYDIAPTLLYLLGLPVAQDMPGKVLQQAIDPKFLAAHPAKQVPSYEGLGGTDLHASRPPGSAERDTGDQAADEEMVAQLRSLGYIGGSDDGSAPSDAGAPGTAGPGPPGAGAGVPAPTGPAAGAPAGTAGVPTILYHANLAGVYLAKRQLDRAEEEINKGLALDPHAPPILLAQSMLHEMRGQPEKAVEILRDLVPADPQAAPARLVTIANLYVRMQKPADGVAYFLSVRDPGTPGFEAARQTGLGIVQAAAGRNGEAETALRQALKLDPVSVQAMQELFVLLDGQGRAQDVEGPLRAGLKRPQAPAMFHNLLGLVLKRRGDTRGAEMELRQALEASPDLVGALANLGGLYLQENRVPEAVSVLESALEKDPRNVEARTNLIVALGMEKNLDAARGRFEDGEKQGLKAPQFYNAWAYALHLNGRREEALEALRQSLRLDPRQDDARRLQQMIETADIAPTGR
ncbi:MAG TPA: alkaline phosphatase family protein [Candidatus Polarisedimenticolia bacterium]|nr:alkaline phosphatase family protein [Candidatus Polarisedimenticolia bacterium]